jgi:hypothetical protein
VARQPSNFSEVIYLNLKQFEPEAARQKHIQIARAGLAKFLASQSVRPMVHIEVEGHPASSEDQVKPFGVIAYRLTRMREIVAFALREARRLSPVKSGRYQGSWFSMIGGSEVAMEAIPTNATVMVTNDQPYARKIHVGARGFEVHRGIVEKVRQLVQQKYGAVVEAQINFITLQGGWRLKRGLRKIHQGRRYGGIRNDAPAGTEITYPTIELKPRLM